MITQQQLQEIREADEQLGDDIRFNPEVYTHRRQLLELIDEMSQSQPEPQAATDMPITVCKTCFLVYGTGRIDCPHCGTVRQ